MRRRAPFDGTHQAQALRGLLVWSDRALRTKSGKTLKDIEADLGISESTLARILSGKTPLKSDQFGPVAHAFDTDKASLLKACFPTLTANDQRHAEVVVDAPWSLRRALAEAGLPEQRIDKIEADTAEWGAKSQRAAATAHILLWQAEQDDQGQRKTASA